MTVYVGLYPMERSPQRQYIRLTTNIRVGRSDDVHHWEDLKEYRSELISGILLIDISNVVRTTGFWNNFPFVRLFGVR